MDNHATINVWDWRKGKLLASVRGHTDKVRVGKATYSRTSGWFNCPPKYLLIKPSNDYLISYTVFDPITIKNLFQKAELSLYKIECRTTNRLELGLQDRTVGNESFNDQTQVPRNLVDNPLSLKVDKHTIFRYFEQDA